MAAISSDVTGTPQSTRSITQSAPFSAGERAHPVAGGSSEGGLRASGGGLRLGGSHRGLGGLNARTQFGLGPCVERRRWDGFQHGKYLARLDGVADLVGYALREPRHGRSDDVALLDLRDALGIDGDE